MPTSGAQDILIHALHPTPFQQRKKNLDGPSHIPKLLKHTHRILGKFMIYHLNLNVVWTAVYVRAFHEQMTEAWVEFIL